MHHQMRLVLKRTIVAVASCLFLLFSGKVRAADNILRAVKHYQRNTPNNIEVAQLELHFDHDQTVRQIASKRVGEFLFVLPQVGKITRNTVANIRKINETDFKKYRIRMALVTHAFKGLVVSVMPEQAPIDVRVCAAETVDGKPKILFYLVDKDVHQAIIKKMGPVLQMSKLPQAPKPSNVCLV